MDVTKWGAISQDSFKEFQYDSGVLVRNFDISTFEAPDEEDIVCSTSGNVSPSCVPTIVDLGDGVNNIHIAAKELQHITRWDCSLGFTALEMSPEVFKLALGAADIDEETGKVTPRFEIKDEDFENLALIMQKLGGGMAVCVIKNAFSTGGLSFQTQKEGLGNTSVTMKGFGSLTKPSEVPMEFYSTTSA